MVRVWPAKTHRVGFLDGSGTEREQFFLSEHGPLANMNLLRYQFLVEKVISLIVDTECNTQATISCVPAVIMTHGKPIAIEYVLFVSLIAINAVKTA